MLVLALAGVAVAMNSGGQPSTSAGPVYRVAGVVSASDTTLATGTSTTVTGTSATKASGTTTSAGTTSGGAAGTASGGGARATTAQGGGARVGPTGPMPTTVPPPSTSSLSFIYRCNSGAKHFDSLRSDCEGYSNEGLMGYVIQPR